ncbi:MAG: ATP:cob(I)alamin adenosyltransferase [Moraxellaceae bacterium]|nr:MAG: ATP:cob(I)alamin adenosyltransferase [Moraxellaceae bacterium]
MGHRLSKIYTRTGDDGTTGLGDGSRIEKDNVRVEAYGAVDELNSCIGMVISQLFSSLMDNCSFPLQDWLSDIQHDLFDLGGELSIPNHTSLTANPIDQLEEQIDTMNKQLPMLKEFILPGGNQAAATCHLARTVCRRAERNVYTLSKSSTVNPFSLKYLNRLSDWLFVAARIIARLDNGTEVMWNRQR